MIPNSPSDPKVKHQSEEMVRLDLENMRDLSVVVGGPHIDAADLQGRRRRSLFEWSHLSRIVRQEDQGYACAWMKWGKAWTAKGRTLQQ